jgi:hypothetical protein
VTLIEPYYEGALIADVVAALVKTQAQIEAIGVLHAILSRYRTPAQHDDSSGSRRHSESASKNSWD